MTRNVLIGCMVFMVLLQGTSALAEDTKMRRNKLMWESMSPEEKNRVTTMLKEIDPSNSNKYQKIVQN